MPAQPPVTEHQARTLAVRAESEAPATAPDGANAVGRNGPRRRVGTPRYGAKALRGVSCSFDPIVRLVCPAARRILPRGCADLLRCPTLTGAPRRGRGSIPVKFPTCGE